MRVASLLLALFATTFVSGGCSGISVDRPADVVEDTLPAAADRVRQAVVEVLTVAGYDVEKDSIGNFRTGYREETSGPWDWLLRWRFGVIKSRVEATVTPLQETSTRLKLHVMYESKDGLFVMWEDAPSALPESVTNQLRLIKNKLKLL